MTDSEGGLVRCTWPGLSDPVYAAYHDTEWGVPHADETRLFEKLILEGFQAGLSWLTILKKRENFRAAFDRFDPEKIASYGERDVARLMNDPGIVRNRLKIEAAIGSAQAYTKLREETTLGALVWSLVGIPVSNAYMQHGEVPAQTAHSLKLSKVLKKRGFRFVGPTTMYAFMQSAGMVNDHLTSCHRHGPCRELQQRFMRLAGMEAAS